MTRGTCSRQILFDVDAENKIRNVRFIGGCSGNLQGIARLVEGIHCLAVDRIEAGGDDLLPPVGRDRARAREHLLGKAVQLAVLPRPLAEQRAHHF